MRRLFSFFLSLLLLFIVCSCTKTDYRSVIPADATLVASVDMRSIAEKSDIGASDMMKKVRDVVLSSVKDDEADKIGAFLSAPSELGIDFTERVYIFKMRDGLMGAVMKVYDADRLDAALDVMSNMGLATGKKKNFGMSVGELMDDCSYAFDGDIMLLVASMEGRPHSYRLKAMERLVESGEENAFITSDTYTEMTSRGNNDICFYGTMSVLPDDVRNTLRTVLPKGTDARCLGDVIFDNGKAVLRCSLSGADESSEKALDDLNGKFRRLGGDYKDMCRDESSAWLMLGVDGKWMLETIKKNESTRMSLVAVERVIDAEQILRSVDGDMSVVFPCRENVNDSSLEFVAKAHVVDGKFMDDVDDWRQSLAGTGMRMNPKGNGMYEVVGDGLSFVWGLNGADFMVSTSSSQMEDCGKTPNCPDDISDHILYMYINPSTLGWSQPKGNDLTAGLEDLNKTVTSVVVKAKTVRDYEVCVTVKDGNTNVLRQLLLW